MKRTRESWRGSEGREGDQRDMEGLERRGVGWRKRKTVRVENWKEFSGFEGNTDGLGETEAGRRGVEDM